MFWNKRKFKFPKKFKISRMEDYHTHYLGTLRTGKLFFGYTTFTFDSGMSSTAGSDWTKFRTEHVVLYLFDRAGKFLEYRHKNLGKTAENKKTDFNAEIEALLAEYGEYDFTDIEVEPFSIEIDGTILVSFRKRKLNL